MTAGEPPEQPSRRVIRRGRLEAFSDGVFAIAITLLVLDIAYRPAPASICSARLSSCGRRTWPL
jgi:uncharacterized membrane protein